MATTETFPTEPLGASGEPCARCGAPLASDQRYCLECGRRRAAARVPYAELLAGRSAEDVLPVPAAAETPGASPRGPRSGLLAAAGPMAAAVLLGLGILIGVLVADEPQPPAQTVAVPAPQKPPVINVTAAPATAAADEELASDWPEGKNGFTVQLRALPKDSSTVAAVNEAKSEAQSKGAPDVGALDSDQFASLEPGNYVVYSGVFAGKGAKKKATAALRKLRKDFSGAKVVEVKTEDAELEAKGERPEEKETPVDDQTLKDLESSTGEAQQKKSAKLPDTLKLPGKPPPPDRKKGGGGTEEQVIE